MSLISNIYNLITRNWYSARYYHERTEETIGTKTEENGTIIIDETQESVETVTDPRNPNYNSGITEFEERHTEITTDASGNQTWTGTNTSARTEITDNERTGAGGTNIEDNRTSNKNMEYQVLGNSTQVIGPGGTTTTSNQSSYIVV